MELSITQPDDWHHHLRDGMLLKTTVLYAAKSFNRCVVMPNLKQPITKVSMAAQYLERIKEHIPKDSIFTPLMTIYLTDNTSLDDIKEAADSGMIYGCKLYPAGATTHSDAGVTKIDKLYKIFEAMSEYSIPLLMHGEMVGDNIDIYDRESRFIDKILAPITQRFTQLKMVLEHITTKEAVEFVKHSDNNIAATITPQHLYYNRNNMLEGGIKPHLYCLPIIKRSIHQDALVKAATSGNKKFFIGTDSAPHDVSLKENNCGCAGIFNSPTALSIYAEVFEQNNALNKLEQFTSFNGPDFYRLPRNKNKISLEKKPYVVDKSIEYGDGNVLAMEAGHKLNWQIKND
jgi:dihydroorotase